MIAREKWQLFYGINVLLVAMFVSFLAGILFQAETCLASSGNSESDGIWVLTKVGNVQAPTFRTNASRIQPRSARRQTSSPIQLARKVRPSSVRKAARQKPLFPLAPVALGTENIGRVEVNGSTARKPVYLGYESYSDEPQGYEDDYEITLELGNQAYDYPELSVMVDETVAPAKPRGPFFLGLEDDASAEDSGEGWRIALDGVADQAEVEPSSQGDYREADEFRTVDKEPEYNYYSPSWVEYGNDGRASKGWFKRAEEHDWGSFSDKSSGQDEPPQVGKGLPLVHQMPIPMGGLGDLPITGLPFIHGLPETQSVQSPPQNPQVVPRQEVPNLLPVLNPSIFGSGPPKPFYIGPEGAGEVPTVQQVAVEEQIVTPVQVVPQSQQLIPVVKLRPEFSHTIGGSGKPGSPSVYPIRPVVESRIPSMWQPLLPLQPKVKPRPPSRKQPNIAGYLLAAVPNNKLPLGSTLFDRMDRPNNGLPKPTRPSYLPNAFPVDTLDGIPTRNFNRAIFNCDGKRWMVPYGVYRCCGQSLYKLATEACDFGNMVVGKGQVPYSHYRETELKNKAKAAAEMMMSNSKALVCQGHRYAVPVEETSFYGCCGSKPVFWPKEICDETTMQVIHRGQDWTTTTSPTPKEANTLLVCDGQPHWIPAKQRIYYGCCGKALYDVRVEQCPPSSSLMKLIPRSVKRAYRGSCLKGYICCTKFPPIPNPRKKLRCCPGHGAYDPTLQRCSPSRRP